MNESSPPPLFPRAVDSDTEPGLGLLALKAENARLRRERNEARQALGDAPDTLPPPTRRQKAASVGLTTGKYAGLFLAAGFVLRFVAKKWPESAELVEGVLGVFGL